MIRVGVIGYGYWGPVVARNFQAADGCQLAAICDANPTAQERARKAFPGVLVTGDAAEIVRSPGIDAVAVITPVWTHFELAKAALENGKHVFVEKPFTSIVGGGFATDRPGRQPQALQIMVDHTFLFTGAVKQDPPTDRRGRARQTLSTTTPSRVNLGLFQHDVNVIWDLAPHDLSIMDYLIDAKPENVSATGQCAPERAARTWHISRSTSRQHHRPHQRELALAGESPHHADRRREEDAGVERSGSRREDQGLRQRRRNHQMAKAFTICWSVIARETCGRPRWSRPKP